MTEYPSAVSVDTAADKVFDYLVNPSNQVHWSPNFKELQEAPKGPLEIGMTFRGKLKVFGSNEFTMDEYDPKRSFRLVLDPKLGHLWHRFTVLPIDTGTQVDHVVGFEPRGLAKLLMPVLRPGIKKMISDLDKQLHKQLSELSKPTR